MDPKTLWRAIETHRTYDVLRESGHDAVLALLERQYLWPSLYFEEGDA